FIFSSRRRHTRSKRDWSSDVCSSDLALPIVEKDEEALVTASFVGDMMFGRYVENITKQHGEEFIFQYVEPFFRASDYVSGNFERSEERRVGKECRCRRAG